MNQTVFAFPSINLKSKRMKKYLNLIYALCSLVFVMFFTGCATTAYISSVNDLGQSKRTYEGDSVYVTSSDKIMSIEQRETKRLIEDTMSRMGFEIKKSNDADYFLLFGSYEKTSEMSGTRPVTNTAVTNVYSGGKSALATTTYTSQVPYSYDYTVASLYTSLMPTKNLKPLDQVEIIWQGYIGVESYVMDKNKAALIEQLFEKMGEDYAKHTNVRRNKSTAFAPTKVPSIYTALSGVNMEPDQRLPPVAPEQISEWRQAAEGGDAAGQYKLGVMYADGNSDSKDDIVAYMWCNLAAAQGNVEARELKNTLSGRMTREQIAEAQKMSREWLAKPTK